jgi:hypothetical protein
MKHFLIIALVFLTAQAFSQKIGIYGGMLTCYRIAANDTIKEHYPISACNIEVQKSKSDIQIFYNTGFTPRKIYGGKWNTTLNGDLQDFIDDFTSGSGGGGGTEIDIYQIISRAAGTDSLKIQQAFWDVPSQQYLTSNAPGYVSYLDNVFNSASSGGAAFVEIAYADLVDLKNNMTLIPGTWYLLNNYKCTFVQPISGVTNTDATDEPLLLFAISNSTLSTTAYSPQYPFDVIQYSLEGSYYQGYAQFGEITRRTDTRRNISVPFDFRNYKVEEAPYTFDTYDGGTTYDFMDIVDDGGTLYHCLWDGTVGITTATQTYWQSYCYSTDIRAVGTTDGFDWHPGNAVGRPVSTGSANLRIPFDFSQSKNFIISGQPEDITGCQFWNEGYFTNCYFTELKNVHFIQETSNLRGNSIREASFLNKFTNTTFEDLTNVIFFGDLENCTLGFGFKNIAAERMKHTKFGNNFESNCLKRGFNYNDIAADTQQNSFGQDIEYVTARRKLYQCHVATGFANCTIYPEVTANDWTNYNAITFSTGQRTMSVHMDNAGLLQLLYLRDNGTFSVNPF